MSLKDFQFLGKLGEGAYSSVYKVKRMIDNEFYAIKKVKLNNLSEHEKQNALNQVRILASVEHPNVIGYKESFLQHSSNFLYIIMEYADDGDLYEKIIKHTKNNTKFTQNQIWSIVIQICRGLKALHDLKILHRDLKSANVFMFKNGVVKLGDMNVSKFSKSMAKTQTGTPYYASPQVWKDLPYDKKSDIWSLGCVIYEAISLKPPFKANDMEGLFKKVTRGFYPRIPPQYTEELSIILKNLLQVTPHLRSTCDKILELPMVMKHYNALPEHMQEPQERMENKLLKTIKLKLDAKQQISVSMPRARYLSTIETSNPASRNRGGNNFGSLEGGGGIFEKYEEEEEEIDYHNIKLKDQLQQDHKLPKLQQAFKMKNLDNYGQYEEPINIQGKYRGNKDDSSLVKKIRQPINSSEEGRVYKNQYQEKHRRYEQKNREKGVNLSDRKLPNILHGRLKSISPENIKKILQQEKEKQKLYSIIGKNN